MQHWRQPGIKRPGKGPKIKTRINNKYNNLVSLEKAPKFPQFHMVQRYHK